MIEEDYVSFETAKLLKEKGFQQLQDNCGYFITEMVYSIDADDNDEHHFAHQYPAGVYNKDKYIAAPTLQMAMKWLREVYQIDIQVFRHIRGKRITFYARIEQNTHLEHQDKCNLYQSYEQACEAAIKYCLEHLDK